MYVNAVVYCAVEGMYTSHVVFETSIWYSSTFLQVLGILAIVEKYSDDKILVLFIEYSDSDTKVILLIRDLKYLVTRTF